MWEIKKLKWSEEYRASIAGLHFVIDSYFKAPYVARLMIYMRNTSHDTDCLWNSFEEKIYFKTIEETQNYAQNWWESYVANEILDVSFAGKI